MDKKGSLFCLIFVLLTVLFISEALVSAEELMVCKGCKYSSIQTAIDKANPGETVLIKEGKYRERISIHKDLILKGKGESTVLMGGEDNTEPTVKVGPNDIEVKLNSIAIKGKKDDSESCEEPYCVFGLAVRGESKVKIENSLISDNEAGIRVSTRSQAILENSTINDNKKVGIQLTESSQVLMKNLSIKNNETGILSKDSSKATVKNSLISNNDSGLYARDSSSATVYGTMFKNNGPSITAEESAKIRINDSTISSMKNNERFGGVSLHDSSHIKLVDSTVSKNLIGLMPQDSAKATLVDNSFKSNKGVIVIDNLVKFSGTIEGAGNKMTNNEENFWSSAGMTVLVLELEEDNIKENEIEKSRKEIINILKKRVSRLDYKNTVLAPLGQKSIFVGQLDTSHDPNSFRRIIQRRGLVKLYEVLKVGEPGEQISPSKDNQKLLYGRLREDGGHRPYLVRTTPDIVIHSRKGAEVKSHRSSDNYYIVLKFHEKTAKDFAQMITSLEPCDRVEPCDRIALVVDGIVETAPVISEEIWEQAKSSGHINKATIEAVEKDRAKALSSVLGTKALPVEVNTVRLQMADFNWDLSEIKAIESDGVSLNFSNPKIINESSLKDKSGFNDDTSDLVKGKLYQINTEEGLPSLESIKDLILRDNNLPVTEFVGWNLHFDSVEFFIDFSLSNKKDLTNITNLLLDRFSLKKNEVSNMPLSLTRRQLERLKGPSVETKSFEKSLDDGKLVNDVEIAPLEIERLNKKRG